MVFHRRVWLRLLHANPLDATHQTAEGQQVMNIIFYCLSAVFCLIMGGWRLAITDAPAVAACYFIMASICTQILFRHIDELKDNK